MRILFLANNHLSPTSGGIERTTYNLIKYLSRKDSYKITACFISIPVKISGVVCIEKTVLNGKEINDVITENKTDIVIFPGGAWYTNELKSYNPATQCKIITCLHSPPKVGEDIYIAENLTNFLNKKLGSQVSAFPRLVYNLMRFPYYVEAVRKNYKLGYTNSDAYVLLSGAYFSDFKKYARLADDKKLVAIGNALSFDEILSKEFIDQKENSVLTVARFHELSKRISLILKTWRILPHIPNWHLDIVGSGPGEKKYRQFVSDHHLRNVIFHGKQIPNEYYKRAKLFLMTSKFEGWPMTVTEAIQSGCVPVVMDSFGALHDIIRHGYNGIIVKNNDVDKMAEEVQMLMDDREKWRQMSLNSLESSKNFTIERISTKWENLFNNLYNAQ